MEEEGGGKDEEIATMMSPKRPGEDDLELAVKRQRMDGALVVAGNNNTSQTNNQLGVTREVLFLLTLFFIFLLLFDSPGFRGMKETETHI